MTKTGDGTKATSPAASLLSELSLREQLIEVLAAETNYIEDDNLGAVFHEALGADAILTAFTVLSKELTASEPVSFVEGESEEFDVSPIRFSYSREGILEITYEPSWETIARGFVPLLPREQVSATSLPVGQQVTLQNGEDELILAIYLDQEVDGSFSGTLSEATTGSVSQTHGNTIADAVLYALEWAGVDGLALSPSAQLEEIRATLKATAVEATFSFNVRLYTSF
jgi:hypothetical protein